MSVYVVSSHATCSTVTPNEPAAAELWLNSDSAARTTCLATMASGELGARWEISVEIG